LSDVADSPVNVTSQLQFWACTKDRVQSTSERLKIWFFIVFCCWWLFSARYQTQCARTL